jgi:hypothetical protein
MGEILRFCSLELRSLRDLTRGVRESLLKREEMRVMHLGAVQAEVTWNLKDWVLLFTSYESHVSLAASIDQLPGCQQEAGHES